MSLLQDLRNLGILGWGFYALDRAAAKLSGGFVRLLGIWFYSQPVGEAQLIDDGARSSMEVSVIGPRDIPEEAFGRPPGVIPERFQTGSVCIAARRGSDLVGFLWLHFGPLSERLVRCDFEPLPRGTSAWDFDLFIAPRYRIGRAFARLWDTANHYLRDRGVAYTGSWVAFPNRASARAHERMGARRVGWAAFLTIGRAQLTLASVSPYVHLSFSERSRCRLRIPVADGAAARDAFQVER